MMDFEKAKKSWRSRLMETTSGQDVSFEDMVLVSNLIQAAEEEIARKDNQLKLVINAAKEKDKEITHLKEKIEVINNEPTLELLEGKAEITRLREALDYAVQLVPDYHDPALQEAAKKLFDMWRALKENSDE